MGSVVDLSAPGVRLPEFVAVDSNVLAVRFLAPDPEPEAPAVAQTETFFRAMQATGGVGIVTPTAFGETLHVAIKVWYRSELANHRPALEAHYGPRRRNQYSWVDLYKLDAGILRAFEANLEDLRRRLVAANLWLLAPDRLGPIPSGLPYDEELVRLIGRYGLDTSDTAILLEARRAGVSAIVTLDRDLRRAAIDFDVYTWA